MFRNASLPIPISQQVFGYYELYQKAPDTSYSNTTIKILLDLEYKQFLAAIEFLYPEAEFSTEHHQRCADGYRCGLQQRNPRVAK